MQLLEGHPLLHHCYIVLFDIFKKSWFNGRNFIFVLVLSNECQRSNDKNNLDAIILQCDNNYEFQLCNTINNNNDDFEDLQLVNNYSNTYMFCILTWITIMVYRTLIHIVNNLL